MEGPCTVECPDGALLEGEPPCVDGYQDYYKSGCAMLGTEWSLIEAYDGDCAAMCGRSCTFIYQGSSYRDTDWFTMTGVGGEVSATCTAEFPLQFIYFYVVDHDCTDYEYVLETGGICEPVTLSYSFEAGQELWLWVGPSVFDGVPESDYILDITGIEWYEPSPLNESTWGSIKGMFK